MVLVVRVDFRSSFWDGKRWEAAVVANGLEPFLFSLEWWISSVPVRVSMHPWQVGAKDYMPFMNHRQLEADCIIAKVEELAGQDRLYRLRQPALRVRSSNKADKGSEGRFRSMHDIAAEVELAARAACNSVSYVGMGVTSPMKKKRREPQPIIVDEPIEAVAEEVDETSSTARVAELMAAARSVGAAELLAAARSVGAASMAPAVAPSTVEQQSSTTAEQQSSNLRSATEQQPSSSGADAVVPRSCNGGTSSSIAQGLRRPSSCHWNPCLHAITLLVPIARAGLRFK